jgi:hypothetical protein
MIFKKCFTKSLTSCILHQATHLIGALQRVRLKEKMSGVAPRLPTLLSQA